MAALLATNNSGTLSGNMLCETLHEQHCITSLKDSAGEGRIIGGAGAGEDYIGIGSHNFPSINGSSQKRIGVIRSYTGPVSGSVLRCFSTSPSIDCQSPAEKGLGPPYLIPYLPVVNYEALKDASDPNYGPAPGSPLKEIAGAMISTPMASTNNYWPLTVFNYNNPSACASTYSYTGHSKGEIVYVQNVPFGGTVGTQDAIVIDGYSGQSTINDHVERAFYVLNLGRVGFGVGWYNPSTHEYDQENTSLGHDNYYEVHNDEKTVDSKIDFIPDQCPQGSAVSLWPN